MKQPHWLGKLVTYAIKGDYDKAANLYLNASKQSQVNSQNPDYMLNAGIYLMKIGEKEEAKILFKKLKMIIHLHQQTERLINILSVIN